jgi:uncharacterized cupredoxin-like copper-binding protein
VTVSPPPHGDPERDRRPASLAPLYVLVIFLAIALTLVLIGAQQTMQHPVLTPAVTQPGTPESPRPVTVIMRDYLFEPNPLILVPGETIRLTVFNAGLEEHELVLGDAAVQAAWATAEAAATPPGLLASPPPASVPPTTGGLRLLLGSGDHVTVDWTVPTATSQLLMQCHLAGHLERGMSADVSLQADGPTSTPGR